MPRSSLVTNKKQEKDAQAIAVQIYFVTSHYSCRSRFYLSILLCVCAQTPQPEHSKSQRVLLMNVILMMGFLTAKCTETISFVPLHK